MQNRIEATFNALRAKGEKGFIAYITAGDPHMKATVELVCALAAAGADVVELGIPFSDPLADGVVNQMAAQRALEAGSTTAAIFEAIRTIRETSQVPLVLFTYLNPVYAYGFDAFHADAHAAGVDGILILDLPPDEASANEELSKSTPLCRIPLIAPTTPADRAAQIMAQGSGFVYYISHEGVTGEQTSLSAGIADSVAALRAHTQLPIAVGFGISTPDQAAGVARSADAVIVGSAIVKRVGAHGSSPDLVQKITDFVAPLISAVKTR